ncbi:MAG: FecR family protein, partial [Flavobacteriaceae bacterium]
MDNNYLVEKWLNDSLTEAEMKEFRQREDYNELVSIIENARMFKASEFSEVDDFENFRTQLEGNKSPSAKPGWIRPLLRMAAVLAV